jgi:CubicO group peptidase (beta-lactamase class C family)
MVFAARLQPYVDHGTVAGVVALAAAREAVLANEAVGFADLAAREPMRPDHLFWIASISKPITGTALMMLVDEGKVDVDAPVETYLPEFRGQQLAQEQSDDRTVLVKPPRPIAVRDVLTHTSGLPFMSRPEAGKIDTLTLREAALTYALSPLGFAPGTKYSYSNAGTNTAGRIVEVVSGMRFEDFLRQRLFEPLRMKDTTFRPDETQLRRLAKAYKPNAAKTELEQTPITQCTYPLSARSRQPSPAGGLFSTAADLASFGRMILRGGELDGRRYLSEAAVQRMTAKQTGALENSYGFGWDCDAATGVCGHGGAYATDLRIDRKRGLVLVYLVQVAGGYLRDEGQQILGIVKQAAYDAYGARGAAGA